MSQVIPFQIRIAYRVTVHGAIPPSPVCLAFSTLYHRTAILSSTFLLPSQVALSAYSPPFPTGHSTGHYVPVAVWNRLTVHGLYHTSVSLSRGSFSRPLCLTVSTHGHAFLRCVSGLRLCASVFGFPLPVFPSCFRFRRSWPDPSMSPWRISDKLSCVDCMRFSRCKPLPDGKGWILGTLCVACLRLVESVRSYPTWIYYHTLSQMSTHIFKKDFFIPPALRENVFQSSKTYVRPLCPKMGERDTGNAIGGRFWLSDPPSTPELYYVASSPTY